MEPGQVDTDPDGVEPVPAGTTRRQCPRCGQWFTWWREYAAHAWDEKP